MPRLSIIIPTYNESANIPILIERIGDVLSSTDYEIIVVDDNSPDRTYEIVQNIGKTNPRVRCIRRLHERGLSSAVVTGMAASEADYFAVMDADLQHDERILPQLLDAVASGSCDLAGGLWVSPYDGVELHDASEVQIDHLVALAEAWYSGADQWTTERRQRFANDLGTPWELNAVSGPVNEAKAASDPAEWLPPEPTAICPYIEAWVATKVRWALAIDPKEATALRRLVVGCPSRHVDVPPAG